MVCLLVSLGAWKLVVLMVSLGAWRLVVLLFSLCARELAVLLGEQVRHADELYVESLREREELFLSDITESWVVLLWKWLLLSAVVILLRME